MKLKVLLVFVLSLSAVFAQVNQVDAQGRKQGEWVKTFENSRAVFYRGQFKDDKPVGTFRYYYPSTKLKAVIKHHDGSDVSEGWFYHENENLMTYGRYKDSKKDSTWYHYGPSGRISFKENYRADSLHGKKVVYFVPEDPNDKSELPSRIMYYDNGKLTGDYIEYFDVGVVRVKGQYKDHKKHGMWEHYEPSGKPMMKIRWKEGNKHGWSIAYEEGKEVQRNYYYYGKRKEGKELKELMDQMKKEGINPNE